MTSRIQWKSQLRQEMSQEDRKRYDIEMEDWADQHDKKKKKDFIH